MIRRKLTKFYNRIKKKSYLSSLKKQWKKNNIKYYAYSRKEISVGLCSIIVTALGHFEFAEKMGLIPVVDMCNNENVYLGTGDIGRINSWEFFFQQPGNVSLEEVSDNSVKSLDISIDTPSFDPEDFYQFDGKYRRWRDLYSRYIRPSAAIQEKINTASDTIIGNDKCLGVYCRGTDYVATRPKNHPVQPSKEMVLEQVKLAMKEQGYEYIYLVTEDEEYREFLCDNLGEDKVRFFNQQKINYSGDGLIYTNLLDSTEYKRKQGEDYFTALSLLAECDGLVAGITSGTVTLMCMLKKPYSYMYIFDLGKY